MQRSLRRETQGNEMMYETQEERCEALAAYLIAHDATVREAARVFSVSKSTVHKDITVRLRYINAALYQEVRTLLMKNKSERHLRGGEATRRKYQQSRETAVHEKD